MKTVHLIDAIKKHLASELLVKTITSIMIKLTAIVSILTWVLMINCFIIATMRKN